MYMYHGKVTDLEQANAICSVNSVINSLGAKEVW